MTELAQLECKVDEALRLLRSLIETPKPHLKRAEFAKLVNRHPNTITRWINEGAIRTEKKGIPRTELAKFTS